MLHKTGKLSILKTDGQTIISEENVFPWPKFIASSEIYAVDCIIDSDNSDDWALLTKDGRVWEGPKYHGNKVRYGSLAYPVSLLRKYDPGFWLVTYSQGAVGAFPAIEPGPERTLHKFRGPAGWHVSEIIDSQMIPDLDLIIILNNGSIIRSLGPKFRLKPAYINTPNMCAAFCYEKDDKNIKIWVIDKKGNINTDQIRIES